MATSTLTQTVDFWTAQAVMASGYLLRLYRILGDDRQAAMARQAGGPSEERAQRLGLLAQVAALNIIFEAEHPEETIGEEKAWQILVESHAGLFAFHGLVDNNEKAGSLRGSRTGTTKAFHKALKGYRTAFPEEMTIPGIQKAIENAANRCAEVFSVSVDGATEKEKSDLRREIHANILEALSKEVDANPS